MRPVNVQQATHVKLKNGQIEKIASTWGIDGEGRLAKLSEGGFGVVTESGQRVSMWEAQAYLREGPEPDLAKLELYAWVGIDELGSGEIGLKQGITPAGLIPMVSMSGEKLKKFWPQAEAQAERYGKRIYLVRFQAVEISDKTKAGE